MDLIKIPIILGVCLWVNVSFGDVLHILRDLEPPHYLYNNVNNEYVPPLESVDLHPLTSTSLPITTTKATTRRPFTTTTEFFLPEIIVNKYTEADEANDFEKDEDFQGYPTIPHPIYLPVTTIRNPIINDPLPTRHYIPPPPSNTDLQTPQADIPVDPISNQYLPPYLRNKQPKNLFRIPTTIQPLRMELNQLRCLASSQNGYFKALLSFGPNSIDNPPVILIDGNPTSSDLHHLCGIRMVRTKVLVNIRSEVFQQCGVEPCGETSSSGDGQQLCVRLSFPQISGMMTAGDATLTLQCKVQELVATQTHSLRVGVHKESQSRMVGAFAHGGSQQPYHTQIGLYRSLRGLNSSPLDPGAIVQLGEELVLRAHVKAGDGWNHTRLADVFLQRLGPNGDILNSANLVTSSGCVNPSMRSVCPTQPVFEAPLGHRLTFKATMFQGMRSGDEMVMSVKVVGCIQQNDCFVDNAKCDQLRPLTRGRRQIDAVDANKQSDDNLPTDVARLSFRVEMPPIDSSHRTVTNGGGRPTSSTSSSSSSINPFAIIGVSATCVLILLALLIGLYLRNRHKLSY